MPSWRLVAPPLPRRLLVAALWLAHVGPGRGPALVGALASAVLGVEPSAQASYAGQTFRCLDGIGAPLPAAAVNDEACDCADGSDEPGTGACAGQDKTLFFCANEGSMPRRLYASRVGDGVCDCCDGSDEASLAKRQPAAKCRNSCAEEGAKKAEEKKEKVEMLRRALQRQDEMRQEGLSSRDKILAEMESLNADLPELEQTLEAAKASADIEREAIAAEEAAKKNASALAAGLDPNCMWRQTGGCSSAGERESANDKPCTEPIAKGMSGYCDCNGDGVLGPEETGYGCEIPAGEDADEKRLCSEVCAMKEDSSSTPEEAPTEEAAATTEEEEKPQISEYTKWMEGAAEATAAAAEAPATEGDASSEAEAPQETAESGEAAAAEETPKEKTAVEKETEAKSKVTEHKEKIQDAQDQLDSLSVDKLGYATLLGKSLSKQISEWRYDIEFFSRASQDSTSLGTWTKWTGPRSAVFEEGTMCWGGPARKLNVNFVCGEREEILDVFEPSRCVYEATIEHPGACSHAELDELIKGSQVVGPKDEL